MTQTCDLAEIHTMDLPNHRTHKDRWKTRSSERGACEKPRDDATSVFLRFLNSRGAVVDTRKCLKINLRDEKPPATCFRTVSNDTAPYIKAHTHTHTHTLTLLLEKRKSVSQVFSSVPLRCVALGQSHHIINMVDAIVITSTKQKHSLTWQRPWIECETGSH